MATSASQLERRHVTTGPADVDVSGLKRALQQAVSGEVRFDAGTRAMYANDFSIYRAVPIGVVIPKGPEDVIAAIAICREYHAPVLPRGCGTAPSGQTTNVAVVFDYSKYYNQIVELDPDSRRAVVEPGVICDQLRNAAEEFNLTYGPDPATHEYCTFGGMLGNNSCGTHSLMAGKTSDNVIELDVVLYDGTRLTVGATSDEELEQIIAAGGRKGEIYDQLKQLSETASPTASEPSSPTSPAACPATTSTSSSPRTASTWPARSSARRARARTCCTRRSAWSRARSTGARSCSGTPTCSRPPITCR